jgi:hypothetical protein
MKVIDGAIVGRVAARKRPRGIHCGSAADRVALSQVVEILLRAALRASNLPIFSHTLPVPGRACGLLLRLAFGDSFGSPGRWGERGGEGVWIKTGNGGPVLMTKRAFGFARSFCIRRRIL